MTRRSRWPSEWPGVICGECAQMDDEELAVVELTDVDPIVFTNGVNGYEGKNCVEYPGWAPVVGCTHDALYPIPLTKAAKKMLAIARAK